MLAAVGSVISQLAAIRLNDRLFAARRQACSARFSRILYRSVDCLRPLSHNPADFSNP